MYTSQELAERIKERAKSKNIAIKTLLSDCDLNVNTLNQLSDKKGLSSFSLARIADYLDCSVDYLLGRTSEPSEAGLADLLVGLSEEQLESLRDYVLFLRNKNTNK